MPSAGIGEYLWYFVYLDCVECRGAIGSEQRNVFVVNDDGPDSYYHWVCYPNKEKYPNVFH